MFSDRKDKGPVGTSGLTNRIAKGTSISGEIISEADFRIDGQFKGNINTTGKVVIGKDGFIDGKIECVNADIEGKFSGELLISNMLALKNTAMVEGDATIGKLAVETGAIFNATCKMKAAGVMPLKTTNEQQKAEKTA